MEAFSCERFVSRAWAGEWIRSCDSLELDLESCRAERDPKRKHTRYICGEPQKRLALKQPVRRYSVTWIGSRKRLRKEVVG